MNDMLDIIKLFIDEWGLVSTLVGGIFTAGGMYVKFQSHEQMLKEHSAKDDAVMARVSALEVLTASTSANVVQMDKKIDLLLERAVK